MYNWINLMCCLSLVLLSEQHYIDKRQLETTESKETLKTPVQNLAQNVDAFLSAAPYEIINFGYDVPTFNELQIENASKTENDKKTNAGENNPGTDYVAKTNISSNPMQEIEAHSETTATVLSAMPESNAENVHNISSSNAGATPFSNIAAEANKVYTNHTENITSASFSEAKVPLEVASGSAIDFANSNTTSSLPMASHTNATSKPSTTGITTSTPIPVINPGWFSQFLSRPGGLFWPTFLLNPFNGTTSTANQITFGFGFFAAPASWRRNVGNVLTHNRYFDGRPLLTATNATPADTRDHAYWNTLHNRDKQKENELAGAWRPNANSVKSQPSAQPQALHFYFPFRFPLQAQIVKESLANIKVTGREVEDQVAKDISDVSLSSSDKCEGKEAVPNSGLNNGEKSSLKFEFELPKPIVKFAKGVMETLMP